MPNEIAKELNLRITQVSSALSGLKKEGLVICLNENVTKGRLYQCTESGKEVLEFLKQ